jgi:hypothetical protein
VLHESEQVFCGVEIPQDLVEEVSGEGFAVARLMRWNRLVFGWQSSPYLALRMFARAVRHRVVTLLQQHFLHVARTNMVHSPRIAVPWNLSDSYPILEWLVVESISDWATLFTEESDGVSFYKVTPKKE